MHGLRFLACARNDSDAMARFKQFVRHAVWPACLIANAVPILITDTFAPEYVPQAAGASTVVLLFVLLALEYVLPEREDGPCAAIPTRMHTLKGARHHAAYAFGRGLFVWLPLLVLGAPLPADISLGDAKVGNTNLGVVLPIWDMLLGTHSDPMRVVVGKTGIQGYQIPGKFLHELTSLFT
jgi:hypothetical protein